MARSAWVLVSILAFAPATALAQEPAPSPLAERPEKRAAREFTEGQRAYEAGDYRRAGASFEAAYAAKPHHDALWNAARSYQKAGEDLRAANLLERYLKEAPADAPDRDSANAALGDVGKRLGRLQVQISGVTSARLDGEPIAPLTIFVAPGEHVVSGDASGKPVRKVFTVRSGELVSVTLSPPVEAPPPPPPPLPHKPLSPWFVVGGSVLVAGGTTLTILSGLDTLKKRDAFLADKTAPKLDAGNTSQTRTNIILASTGGVALVTAVIAAFFVDWGSDSNRAARSWNVGVGPGGVTVGGGFP